MFLFVSCRGTTTKIGLVQTVRGHERRNISVDGTVKPGLQGSDHVPIDSRRRRTGCDRGREDRPRHVHGRFGVPSDVRPGVSYGSIPIESVSVRPVPCRFILGPSKHVRSIRDSEICSGRVE